MRLAKDKFFQISPPWVLPDKREHLFGSGYAYCLLLFLLPTEILCWIPGVQELIVLLGYRHTAAILAWTGGFLWEIKDGFRADGFSWRDLVADTIGIGILWSITNF